MSAVRAPDSATSLPWPTPVQLPFLLPSPSTTATPEPAGVTLREVDGGVDYYSRFSNPLPIDPNYFPIGVWGSYNLIQSNIALDKAVGLNLYVWIADPASANLAGVRANGMHAILPADERTQYANVGSETVGWYLRDEIDARQSNEEGAATARAELAAVEAKLPDDGRARYNNYGKGVAFWNTDSDAEQYVNDFQQLVSDDVYWQTDPGTVCTQGEGGTMVTNPRDLTEQECRRSANYGWIVDRMRQLDAMDGQRQPIWSFVEVGCPFSDGDCITPEQIRAAVWHSIIAGARGVLYFNHSFGGPEACWTHQVLRDPCYSAARETVAAVNAQITKLAPVLNAPFADGYARGSSAVRVMVKKHSGTFYLFAGAVENANETATIEVKSGSSAKVVGENRAVPITNGRITDNFDDGNAVHIYEILP